TRLAEPVLAATLPAKCIELLVRVPRRDRAALRIDWRFVHEDGTIAEGSVDADELPLHEATDVDGVRHEARRLELGLVPEPAPGYHRLGLRAAGSEVDVLVIVSAARCFLPPALRAGQRIWGWAVQLYGLRSSRN